LDHQLEKLKEGLIDMPFEDKGSEIIDKFKNNFKKLVEFID
jgi:hypothetical protein